MVALVKLIAIVLLPLAAAESYEYVLHRKDQSCEPSTFGIEEFEGLRLQHQVVLGMTPKHHLRFSACQFGEHIGTDAYLPLRSNATGDYVVIPWGAKICTMAAEARNQCFWMSRTKEYAFRSIPLTIPGQLLGVLYDCPGDFDYDGIPCFDRDEVKSIKPLYILIADDPYYAWYEGADRRHTVLRTPFAMAIPIHFTEFYDTDMISWRHSTGSRMRNSKLVNILDLESVSPWENYTYPADRLERRAKADSSLNKSFPMWKGWLNSKDVVIPKDYNTYMGDIGKSYCGKIAESIVNGDYNGLIGSIDDGYAECATQFPTMFDKLLKQLEPETNKQTRHHLMPYYTKSIIQYYSIPYSVYRRLLQWIEKIYD